MPTFAAKFNRMMVFRTCLLALLCVSGLTTRAAIPLSDSLHYHVEMQVSLAWGDHTPLWLNANKHGLSSLDKSNGYLRAGLISPLPTDSTRQWGLGYGLDMALAYNYTSSVVVQQAYVEARWRKGVLTLGAKEMPMALKPELLTTGSQTLGRNARPIPQIRVELPDYYPLAFTKGLVGLRGHIAYGWTTDDGWQVDFTQRQSKYTVHAMIHTKAAYLKIGKPGSRLSFEGGLEMASQFGGTSYIEDSDGGLQRIANEDGLPALWHALVPGGSDVPEDVYKNTSGNNLGSWLARINLDYDQWYLGLYFDHFFEDHSQLYFVSYDGYGTGSEWNTKKDARFAIYYMKDMLLGLELRLKRFRYLDNVAVEYLYTKYQSGPIYHDRTPSMPDNIFGRDDYYNHYIFTGWQHWGQVIGNPLYRSPIYNNDGRIYIQDNRFFAWHLGLSGHPIPGLGYRLLATWQRGFGTYAIPYPDPEENVSLLAEADYAFPRRSPLAGWSVKLGLGWDRGDLLGDNTGLQLTIAKRGLLSHCDCNNKRRKR